MFIHPRDAFGVLIQIEQPGPDYHIVEPVKRPAGKRFKVKAMADGCELRLHHPGGVELALKLDKEETKELAKELQEALGWPGQFWSVT
jgi:methylmalonyl-CoA/ethylmalonyl-CoA epimerase